MLRKNSILKKKKNGQSTLEYLVLFAGVVAILLAFLGPNGVFRSAYNRTLISGTDSMEDVANFVGNSFRPAGY